ncbi:GtrA family protein [Ochrobactrum sp. BD67]
MTTFNRKRFLEFQRFFAASLCGVILDIALSYALVHSLGLAILIASTVSLFIAAGLMYFVHEHWTFGGDGRFSSRRLIQTLISALAALIMRTLVLTSFSFWVGDKLILLQLATAVTASFLVNYLLVRRIMHRSGKAIA